MLTVFMWYCRTRGVGGGRDLRTDVRSFDHKLHFSIRWWAVMLKCNLWSKNRPSVFPGGKGAGAWR